MLGEGLEVGGGQGGAVYADQVAGDGPAAVLEVECFERVVGVGVDAFGKVQDPLLTRGDAVQELLGIDGLRM